MHPRERVLERAKLCELHGLPIPVDLLAEAVALGIELSVMGQPKPIVNVEPKAQGDF